LILGAAYEGDQSSFTEVIDLNPEEYYTKLYRGRRSSTTDTWSYFTSYSKTEACDSYGTALKAPCASTVIHHEGINGTMAIQAACIASNNKGLKICDEIVKTIRKSNN
jgi:hypothetical protein